MNISGLLKTTLLDFPGHVAATIFIGGCNFRCPFCHNMNLVTGEGNSPAYTIEEIMQFLRKRKGILDGVCITGGEPTLYAELKDLIIRIKELGYLVKLDTNGSNSKILKELVDERLIDYVAMDIKSSRGRYLEIAGLDNIQQDKKDYILKNIDESVSFLLTDAVDYEFRTTIVKEYHDKEVIKDIGKYISGAKRYYLQSYTESEYVMNKSLSALGKENLMEFTEILKPYVNIVEIRGLD